MLIEKRAGKRKSDRVTASFYIERSNRDTITRLWRLGAFDSKSHVVDDALSRILPEMEREAFAAILDRQLTTTAEAVPE